MSWGVGDVTVMRGSTVALDRVSLLVEPGEIHAVVGGDGAGKSTLLEVLAGLDRGQQGTMTLPEPGRIGYVPARAGVFGELTVAENLEFVAQAHRLRDWRHWADALLDRAGLAAFTDRLAARLSGGQRRKLAGCMALLPRPPLVVLDEVSTGVDPVSRMEIWRLVAGVVADGTAAVFATTYLDEAERAERITLLHGGRVLASGTAEEIVASVPGSVSDAEAPDDRATAWRRGRRWRQWNPAGSSETTAPSPLGLEDAAIVFELVAERVGR